MTDQEPVRRSWVLGWVRDEAWWRDVASQSLGGILAATVVAVLGLVITGAAGLIAVPIVWKVLLSILIGLVAIAVIAGVVVSVNFGSKRLEGALRDDKIDKVTHGLLVAFGVVIYVFVPLLAFLGAINLILHLFI